jgi:hypothetical protein
VAEVAVDPERFSALTAVDREGWVALHAGDLDTAARAFPDSPTPRARAHLARAALRDELAATVHHAAWRTLVLWREFGLPVDEGVAGIGPLWATCGGQERVPSAAREGVEPLAIDGPLPDWAAERVARYADADGLVGALDAPVATLGTRVVRDPCALQVLAEADLSAAAIALDVELAQLGPTLAAEGGLAGRFLSPTPTAADLVAERERAGAGPEAGARSPSLPPPSADLPAEIAALDGSLAALSAALDSAAPPEGRALVDELQLVGRLRQEVLLARAREALREEHPQRALALADVAWDATHRGVGPGNPPGLASVRALALVRLGRSREALDALAALGPERPEAALARE